MNDEMVSWLTNEVKNRGWSLRELGRRADISHATISNIISGQTNPGFDFCVGIAKALDMPAEDVLRRAGLLPALPEENTIVHAITNRLRELQAEGDTQELLLTIRDIVETLYQRYQTTKLVELYAAASPQKQLEFQKVAEQAAQEHARRVAAKQERERLAAESAATED